MRAMDCAQCSLHLHGVGAAPHLLLDELDAFVGLIVVNEVLLTL